MVGPARPQFVLFGSSIVQYSFSNGGWGATLADIYSRKADIIVRGYAGWNSRRALAVLEQVFPKDTVQQPSLIIVYFGGNDSAAAHPSGLGTHVPLDEYVENMKKIATYLKELSESTQLIFLSCPPVNEDLIATTSLIPKSITRTNDLCRQYSEACIQLCNDRGLKVIDLWSAIQTRQGWKNACFTDGIHLTSDGSDIIVNEILKMLKSAEWKPSLYWKEMPTEFAEDSPYDPVASDNKSTINASELTSYRKQQWD